MYEIFERLLKEKGVSTAEVCKAIGMRQGVISDWKYGRYTPKADKLRKIADYFGVSLEYLQTGSEANQAWIIFVNTGNKKGGAKCPPPFLLIILQLILQLSCNVATRWMRWDLPCIRSGIVDHIAHT